MNADEREDWHDEVLSAILAAISTSAELVAALEFKGARILKMHLPDVVRRSMDLDANLTAEFVARHPERIAQATALRERLVAALRHDFERARPVRYTLIDVRVEPLPPVPHPLGWDGFRASIRVNDAARPLVSNLRH
jgi:hypothetical protein